MNPESLARIASRYSTAGAWDRFHVKHRLRLCPHDALLPYLPNAGNVLDIGCGFGLLGLYLQETRPALTYYGADIDERKIALARAAFAARTTGPKPEQLFAGDVLNWRDRPSTFRVVTILDVLLLMPVELQKRLFDFSCSVLDHEPDAALLLKILPSLHGAARYRTWVQENIMVRVLRKTRSSGALFTTQDPALYESWGRAQGLVSEEVVMPTTPPSSLLVLRRQT